MNKQLKKIKSICFVIYFIEFLLIAALGVFYYLDLFNVQNIFQPYVIYCVLACMFVLSAFILWIAFIKFNKIRRKSDLVAADLLGSDIQETYNFGMIGYIVVDSNDQVLWVNELFKDRQIDILDQNILEWQPELKQLKEFPDKIIKIEFSSHNYDVKYLSDAGLYIFKDTTEYENLYSYSKKEALVLGLIVIDNYNDISGDSDDVNDIMSKVRNEIFEYSKDFEVLLKRYKSDTYFLICNNESLQKMIEDKFSLLSKIHKVTAKEIIKPTLSIGIAHDFPDVAKLNEMASNAIDIAMSRGGDQVVVSKYGTELEFFGGKSEALETRNKVKVRVLADSVISLIREAHNVIIMGHTMTDMDSLGSCLGVKAICDYCEKTSHVVYDPKSTERKTKSAITTCFTREQVSKVFISPADAIEKLKSNTLVIVCDVHKPSMTSSPKLLEKALKVMVIDHHRRSEEFIDSPVFSYIDSSASSASELVAELIKYATANPRIELNATYASIMLSGIFMDTNYYKTKTCGIRTFEASMILKEYGADNSLADDLLKDELEEFRLISDIISKQKTPYYGIVYCKADEQDIIEQATIAKVANQCMQMKGVNACFVIGNTSDKETRISCRSDGSVNVQLLAEKMNGGGHFTSAAVLFKNGSIDKAENKLLDVLAQYLNDASTTSRK